MVIPRNCPPAAGSAPVSCQRENESGAAEAAELVRLAGRGRNLPARMRGARRIAGLVMQQQAERTALARRKRESPRRGEINLAMQFRDHGRQRAALERLLHGEQRIDGARHARDQQPLGLEPELVETWAVERASFETGEIRRDPERLPLRFARAGGERERKAGRGAEMQRQRRAHLMQGRAGKAAAERRIDRREAEGDAALGLDDALGLALRDDAAEATQMLLHRLGREHERVLMFMICSSICPKLRRVKAVTKVKGFLWFSKSKSQSARTAVTSTSTLNSGRVNPETITSVEAKALPGT